MKKMIALLMVVFASLAHAEALQWTDLELYQTYKLNQTITFPEGIEYKAGEKVYVMDYIAGGIPVVYWQMHMENCKNPDATADMILINPSPDDTSTDRSIAVALTEGCNLDVWVEIKDLYSGSILDADEQSLLNLRRH